MSSMSWTFWSLNEVSVALQSQQSCPMQTPPRASFSFSTCDSWSAAWRRGFSLRRWPEVRVQHEEKTLSNCLAGNRLMWGEGGWVGWEGGGCPFLLNHHPDLCPHCGHSGWCYCTWIHTPSTNTYEHIHGQTLRDTHAIYHWHHCGNNRDDPNHQRGKKGKLSPIPLPRLHFIAGLHCALLMTWHWRMITYIESRQGAD